MWVVDSSDVTRLDLVKQELDKVLQQERLAGATLLVWANKQDLVNKTSEENVADIRKALRLDDTIQYANRHWSIHPCSAMTGQGLMEGMDWLVDDISSRIFLLS